MKNIKKIKERKNKLGKRLLFVCVALLVFLVFLRIFSESYYSFTRKSENSDDKILNAISANIIKEENEIDEEHFAALLEKEYLELKKEFGLADDFCIFFQKPNGSIVQIDGNRIGLGSKNVKVNGKPCGK